MNQRSIAASKLHELQGQKHLKIHWPWDTQRARRVRYLYIIALPVSSVDNIVYRMDTKPLKTLINIDVLCFNEIRRKKLSLVDNIVNQGVSNLKNPALTP